MLTINLIKREISVRYKDSILGVFWSFLTPLFLLIVYTFVFTVIFKSRWGTEFASGSQYEYALLLFSGLALYNFLAEVVMLSPSVIPANVNYVKKVVFPLHIFPIVKVGSALFHLLISLFVLMLFVIYVRGALPWTTLLFPVVLAPLVFMVLGLGWILSSLGPFIKDISLVLGPIVTAALFIGPILYPREAMPGSLQPWLNLNPLTIPVEQIQDVMIWGVLPDLIEFSLYAAISIILAVLGYLLFHRVKLGFSDVL
jgi:lipopolysaccharide transport system permease protein